MSDSRHGLKAACRCGEVAFECLGSPIVHTKCYCTSCRTAGLGFEQVPGAPKIVDDDGGTDMLLFRKDRIGPIIGLDRLRERRLTPKSATRRMVTTCCDTPMFLEFTKGHWVSIYAACLPGNLPPLDMRVMVADRPAGPALPADVPSYRNHYPLHGGAVRRLGRHAFPDAQGHLVMAATGKFEMLNVNSTRVVRVDADKYCAVRDAVISVLTSAAPGLTLAELKQAILPLLPEALFPGGAKLGWWMMGVQLDLRARRVIVAEQSKPMRLHLCL